MKRESIAKYIGLKIKEYRESKKIKQEELGELLGLSRISILNMEAGKHRASVDTIFYLCGIFKCKVGDLFPPIKTVKIVFEEKEIKIKKKIRKIKVVN